MYNDSMSHLSLTNNIFTEVINEMRKLVPKMLMLGAGGYNPRNIARDWTLAWAVLHDAEPDSDYFPPGYASLYLPHTNCGGPR
jgi:acetoin utilization deacetylase AcuC-like enzyme